MSHEDFGGFDRDMKLLHAAIRRRDFLRLGIGATVMPLLGCSDSPTDNSNDGDCRAIPQETAGPFPGDGSNSAANVLNQSAAVRNDIRSSFGGLTGTADGVPLHD